MSLSNPRTSQSPVRRFFRLKGASGELAYWDKADSQEKTVNLPFAFVVLDTLNTVSGFHESSNSSIWANEIRNTREEPLTIRSRDGVLVQGLWSEVGDRAKSLGGKFANSLYIAFKDGDELAIGNVLLAGAALSAFFDFRKGKNLDSEPGVSITSFKGPLKKGRTEYYVPEFGSWTPNDLSAATALDATLQDFLNGASKGQGEPVEQGPSDPWAGVTPSSGFSDTLEEKPPF